MITVKTHGTNRFTLKGDSLKTEPIQESSVTLQRDGWTVTLNVPNFGLLERTGITSDRVVPTIILLLDDVRAEEDIDDHELRKYMRVVWRDFRYLLTESEQRRVVAP